jgi:uncharacterized protein YggL (DUF469 family)
MIMTKDIVRSKRLRKKLYLAEFAIMGFEFSCKINLDSEAEYEQFFDSFADLVDSKNLFVSLDNVEQVFEGFVTSGERYGSATAEDRKAIEDILNSYKVVSDVVMGELVDAYYNA